MTVYNYFRATCADGAAPAEDASPEVVAAVEQWLGQQQLAGEVAITVGEVANPPLALLVLHSEGPAGITDLIHVVVVPGRTLASTSPKLLRRFFETLYGGSLDRVVAKFRADLGRIPYAEGAPRILSRFATAADIESLPWDQGRRSSAPLRAPEPSAPASRDSSWLLPGAVVVGALVVLAGVLAGAQIASRFDRVASLPNAEVGLRAEVAALESRLEALDQQIRNETKSRRAEFAQLAEARAAPQPIPAETLATAAEPERKENTTPAVARDVASTSFEPAVLEIEPILAPPPPTKESKAKPVVESVASDESQAEVASLPAVASGPRNDDSWLFRVSVNTARIRQGPSAESATLGLLAKGTRVDARSQLDEWIEIDPPEGFEVPAWIHTSLVSPLP